MRWMNKGRPAKDFLFSKYAKKEGKKNFSKTNDFYPHHLKYG
jgi:hypothetical protein